MTLTCSGVSAAYALGFLDCKDISARCMLTIFQFFATKTDASKLRMLSGSPKERLLQPIMDYIEARGGRFHIRWGCRYNRHRPCTWVKLTAYCLQHAVMLVSALPSPQCLPPLGLAAGCR